MKKELACPLLILALLLAPGAFAVEENVVVELPTVAPMVRPTASPAPNYLPDGLVAYYWDGVADPVSEQTPALSDEEKQRLPGLLSAYEKGERPSESVLHPTEKVTLGVYALNPEDYDGERAYVLLPNVSLTDDQLLAIIDAYAQLGLSFSEGTLGYRNCMRGGGTDYSRYLIGEEHERETLLYQLYRRQELRPQSTMPPLPRDGGIARIDLNGAYYEFMEFRFVPYRRLTDEELLQYIDATTDESVTPAQYIAYEKQARSELARLAGAPLTLKLNQETVTPQHDSSIAERGEYNKVYGAFFHVSSTDVQYDNYSIVMDTETGICRFLAARVTDEGVFESSPGIDHNDPIWSEIARGYVESIRADGVQVKAVEAQDVITLGSGRTCVNVLVAMEDGGCYDLTIACDNNQVVDLSYSKKPQQSDD